MSRAGGWRTCARGGVVLRRPGAGRAQEDASAPGAGRVKRENGDKRTRGWNAGVRGHGWPDLKCVNARRRRTQAPMRGIIPRKGVVFHVHPRRLCCDGYKCIGSGIEEALDEAWRGIRAESAAGKSKELEGGKCEGRTDVVQIRAEGAEIGVCAPAAGLMLRGLVGQPAGKCMHIVWRARYWQKEEIGKTHRWQGRDAVMMPRDGESAAEQDRGHGGVVGQGRTAREREKAGLRVLGKAPTVSVFKHF
ncbi:hypothetical protein DFH09DRAFT_1088869 [Mycena vulgaris]|nr:hypothetical protein DFH09DRAFT_1088869 [Mycena vulgaris]